MCNVQIIIMKTKQPSVATHIHDFLKLTLMYRKGNIKQSEGNSQSKTEVCKKQIDNHVLVLRKHIEAKRIK